ncbi:MAG TPA: immune inhibitor A domain-containing protein, partial [Gemmatimonadales bacterium]|nr:immune inhibitor A domain-containing protein [Gemmatimonadales bacterium]
VDMVMFVQPAKDGACGLSNNNHLWSHRYVFVDSLENAYQDVVTTTPKAGGGFIRIRNYFLQSGVGGSAACDSTQIMPVGTAAHESGHGLGLPDLYDTGNPATSEGIGEWGLMGSGNYTSPFSPSRMEVWSLNELGWVTLVPLTTGGDYSVGPAPTADTAFYVRVNGANPRGEYFLLENRERTLADSAVIRIHCQVSSLSPGCDGGGLAIWHVDSEQIVNHGFNVDNTVNVGPIHGLALVQADGLDQLGSGANRGDAGDLYAGPSGNSALGINTSPAAVKNSDGSFAGFVIDSIRKVSSNGPVAFRIRFGGLTSVRGNDTSAFISVDAINYHIFRGLFDSGSVHTVAVPDTQYRASDSLVRWAFSSWSDGLGISHTVTGNFAGDSLTALLNRAFRVKATILSGGTATSNPAGVLTGAYFAPSTSVSITAHPTSGNIFLGWSGDTTASDSVLGLTLSQPYRVTANFSAPLQLAAVLQQLFSGSSTLSAQQINYLDANGNKNGGFTEDVGDFLAWVRATHAVPAAPPAPGSPLTARLPLKGGRP